MVKKENDSILGLPAHLVPHFTFLHKYTCASGPQTRIEGLGVWGEGSSRKNRASGHRQLSCPCESPSGQTQWAHPFPSVLSLVLTRLPSQVALTG